MLHFPTPPPARPLPPLCRSLSRRLWWVVHLWLSRRKTLCTIEKCDCWCEVVKFKDPPLLNPTPCLSHGPTFFSRSCLGVLRGWWVWDEFGEGSDLDLGLRLSILHSLFIVARTLFPVFFFFSLAFLPVMLALRPSCRYLPVPLCLYRTFLVVQKAPGGLCPPPHNKHRASLSRLWHDACFSL